MNPEQPTVDASVAVIPTGVGPASLDVTTETELREALFELARAQERVYYDAARDRRERETYYAGLSTSLPAAQLFAELSALVQRTHGPQLPYRPITEVYPWVDLRPNGKVRSIYSDCEVDPEEWIREDIQIETKRAALARELLAREPAASAARTQEALDQLEERFPYNCEHAVPQSWFGKHDPMRGDLHHLFACATRCNSFRGNSPYFDFPDYATRGRGIWSSVVRSECGKREGDRFEPHAGKGAVARAVLYFLLRYRGVLGAPPMGYDAERLDVLLQWHRDHPVGRYERHRNMAICAKQGNRNPFIDYPEFASYIDITTYLG